MSNEPRNPLPRRRSARLPVYDYATPDAYFVTVCSAGRALLFGDVADDRAVLSPAGAIVEEEWAAVAIHRPDVEMDAFVVMPNHVHGIVRIASDRPAAAGGIRRGSLGAIVGAFKAAAARRIAVATEIPRGAIWQRGYWDRVIRDDDEMLAIRRYITENPAAWVRDRLHPRRPPSGPATRA